MRAYGCWHGWSAWWGSMGHPPELDWPSTRDATNGSVIDSTSSPPTGGQAMMCSWRRLAICSTSFVVRLFCHQAPSEYLSSGWHFEKALTNFARVTSCVGLSWWTHINISPVGASWLPDNICVLFFPAFLLCFLLGFGALSSKSAKMVHASSVAWLVRLLAAEGVSIFDVLSFSISTLGTRFVGRPFLHSSNPRIRIRMHERWSETLLWHVLHILCVMTFSCYYSWGTYIVAWKTDNVYRCGHNLLSTLLLSVWKCLVACTTDWLVYSNIYHCK